MSLPNNNRRY